MDTGMDSFELCACSRWGTAYRAATGTGTAWNIKMPDLRLECCTETYVKMDGAVALTDRALL